MFEKYKLLTAWHLTDVENIESIMMHGILSRKALVTKNIVHQQVGWEKIVAMRDTVIQESVLTFVSPYNKFISGRFKHHLRYHPKSQGLCLLEIDLVAAIAGRREAVKITNGNQATQRFPVASGPIDDLATILDWNSHLNEIPEGEDALVDFAKQAELLLPSPVLSSTIRRIWVENSHHQSEINDKFRNIKIDIATDYFACNGKLPEGVVNNFVTTEITPMPIMHNKYGRGEYFASLGDKFVCRFKGGGTFLLDPDSFEFC